MSKLIETVEALANALRDHVKVDGAVYVSLAAVTALVRQHEAEPDEVNCKHEPYHGRCCHCDTQFKDGRPLSSPVAPPKPYTVAHCEAILRENLGLASGPDGSTYILGIGRAAEKIASLQTTRDREAGNG